MSTVTLILMCGLPGSGKSTKARAMAAVSGAQICSADDYFIINGKYTFDPLKLPEAHQLCRERAAAALRTGQHVIIDNTNLRREHRDEYRAMAAAMGAGFGVVFSDAPWRWNPTICQSRCTHGVPLAEIERMLAEFEADAVA